MRRQATWGVAVLGLLLTGAARAQDVRPAAATADRGPHRMEIWNGPIRTVHYFPSGNSPGEALSLRELARAENEADNLDDLQALRRQYLAGERILEARRQRTQSQ